MMNKLKLILPILIIVGFMFSFANATTPCGIAPAGTLGCFNFTIVNNNGNNAMVIGNQINITLNGIALTSYINSGFNNIVFYNGVTGNIIASWMEGNTANELQSNSLNTVSNVMFWIRMNSTIATSTTATNVISMAILSTGTTTLNGLIGEAPQLTCVAPSVSTTNNCNYGLYDNGANVFTALYQNFKGTSVPSGWTESGAQITVANGLLYSSTAGSGYYIDTNANFGAKIFQRLDYYGNYATTSGSVNSWSGYNLAGGGTALVVWFLGGNAQPVDYFVGNSGTQHPNSNNHVWSIYWYNTKNVKYSTDYGTQQAVSDGSGTGVEPVELVGTNGAGGGNVGEYYWVRMVTQQEVYATISNSVEIQLPTTTLTVNPTSVTYPNTATLTATCSPGTDTCDIDSPLGTHLATGTGSATYTSPIKAPGTYTYYANDITGGSTVSNTLTVTKGTPTMSCTNNGNTLVNFQVFGNYLFANSIIGCTISSQYNQLSATLSYNSVTENTGTGSITYNAQWNNLVNTANFVETGNGNYLVSNVNFGITDVAYNIISNPTGVNPGYETGTYPFNYNINITKAASSANVLFFINNVFTANSLSTSIPSTNQIFPFTNTINLLPVNNVNVEFNGLLNIQIGANWGGAYLHEGVINTIDQQQLWNYIPSVSFSNANIVLGQNQIVSLTIQDLQSFSALSSVATDVQINGNANTIGDVNVGGYNYNALIFSFTPQQYGLSSPSIGSPLSVTPVNQVLQLFYGGANVFRNTNGLTFNAFQEAVVPCGGGNTVTLQWNFYRAPAVTLVQSPQNILLNGYFVPTLNNYNGVTIQGSSAGLPAAGTATSNSYQTCLYPNWGQFNVQGAFQYNDSNPLNSIVAFDYLVNQQLSNTITPVNLYLTQQTNPSQYDIVTENITTGQNIASLVQVLLFLQNTNSSIVVDELKTASNGGAVTTLSIGSSYKFYAYGLITTPPTLIGQAGYIPATSCSPNTCLQIIPVGSLSNNFLPSVLGNVQQSCTQIPGAGNTMTISCTYLSLNASSQNARLQIFQSYNPTATCTNSVSGSSGSILCTVGNTASTIYNYYFQLNLNGAWITINQNTFGTQTSLFGVDGGFIALMFTIVLVLIFVTINFNIALMLGGLGMIVSGILGFVTIPSLVSGALLLFLGVVLYIINRDPGNR